MSKHKHCDLIKAWADGAAIEYYDVTNDTWDDISVPSWHTETLYRLKPKLIDNILDNIPENGVLCWVSDEVKNPNSDNYLKIINHIHEEGGYFDDKYTHWNYVIPLTKEEIMSFIYE